MICDIVIAIKDSSFMILISLLTLTNGYSCHKITFISKTFVMSPSTPPPPPLTRPAMNRDLCQLYSLFPLVSPIFTLLSSFLVWTVSCANQNSVRGGPQCSIMTAN